MKELGCFLDLMRLLNVGQTYLIQLRSENYRSLLTNWRTHLSFKMSLWTNNFLKILSFLSKSISLVYIFLMILWNHISKRMPDFHWFTFNKVLVSFKSFSFWSLTERYQQFCACAYMNLLNIWQDLRVDAHRWS